MKKIMMGNQNRETVLYYNPGSEPHVAKLKGVLVQMGIRIKQIGPDQRTHVIGAMLGMEGIIQDQGGVETSVPEIPHEMLVMHGFSSQRVDELVKKLRKAGVPKINLKAVVTEHNCKWTFYHLYQEIKDEHEKMQES